MSGSTFNYSANTLQMFTAGSSGGTYQITAIGAQGQNSSYGLGGTGADLVADFTLAPGEQLTIVVGGYGTTSSGDGGGGGGGGTFVIETNTGSAATHQVLLVAGGGGGAGFTPLGGYQGTGGPASGGNALFSPTGGAASGGSGHGGAGSTNHGYGGGGGGGYAGGAGGFINSGSTETGRHGAAGVETAGSNTGNYAYANYAGGSAASGSFGSAGYGGFGGGGGGGYFGGGGGGGGFGGGTGGAGRSGTASQASGYGGTGGGSYSGGTFVSAGLSSTGGNGSVEVVPLCFLRGTNILTPTGQVAVEDLRIGDTVVTRFGGIRPIKWIGRQTHSAASVGKDLAKVPVCVRAGAIAQGVPARDLYISPGHSMLVDGNLLIGSLMVNGLTVTQDWCPLVIDYYHIELDVHDCVIAEGAWSETYADAQVSRERFHNAAEFHALYPDNGPAPDEFSLCAPRPEHGSQLEQALRSVAARCADRVLPGRLHGSVDVIEGAWRVKGWAHDLDHPCLPILLDVEVGGEVVGQVLACDEREDLQQAGFGRGRCAFSFTSPRRLTPDVLATLRVRRAADGEELPIHPACSAAGERVAKAPTRPGLRLVA